MKPRSRHVPITMKVICPACRHFVGFIRADGSAPLLDECQGTRTPGRGPHPVCDLMDALEIGQLSPDAGVPPTSTAKPLPAPSIEGATLTPDERDEFRKELTRMRGAIALGSGGGR